MSLCQENLVRQFKSLISKNDLSSLILENTRFRIFDPSTTLHLWIYQVASVSSSRSALVFFNSKRIANGERPVKICSSAFSRAKKKLNSDAIVQLVKNIGHRVSRSGLQRKIYYADGTIIKLQDTSANESSYPKSKYKKQKVGLPKLRLLGLFCGDTGAYLDGEICPYSGKGTAETSLMLKLVKRIKKGSVLVLDRFFTSLHMQAVFQEKGIDYVIRSREKFAKKVLGRKNDLTVTLKKRTDNNKIYPPSKSREIRVRVIRGEIRRPGFRQVKIFILTSLFKAPREEVERIYLERWNVELDIRNLKTSLESSVLQSKSPQQAEKELWVRLLTYNIIRSLTVISSCLSKSTPRKVSFKLCRKALEEFIRGLICGSLLESVGKFILKAKYRREPRAIKNRPNSYPYLTTTKEKAKKQDWGYKRRRPSQGPRTVLGALSSMA